MTQHVSPRRAALTLAALGCAALLAGCPRFSPNVEIVRDIPYGAGYVRDSPLFGEYRLKTLRMDILAPTDIPAEMRPAVVFVHGGGFTDGGRDDEDQVVLADALASQGYVCFLIDYRLAGDNPPAPPGWDVFFLRQNAIHAAFVDTKTALRHIRANAADYGIDPDRIAVLGSSAGAFASAAAGVTPADTFARDREDLPDPMENVHSASPRVQAAVVLWGNAGLVLDEFTPDDPPMMIVHGEEDAQLGTPFNAAIAMRDACVENGIPHAFYPVPGAGHGAWDARVGGKNLAELVLNFLEFHL